MIGIKPEEIDVDGKKLKAATFEEQKLVSVKDLALNIGTKETPNWIYSMCQSNPRDFKKITIAYKMSGHVVNRPQWFANVNGVKSIYQELVKKYGISSYTKKFYLFSGKVAAALMKKPEPQESKEQSNQPLHLIAKVENNRPLVSARDLHKALKLKTHFLDWVKQNFKDFEKGYDYFDAVVTAPTRNGAMEQLKDYWMTTDMAKELCMLSRTPKGKQVRRYFIQVEKKYRQQASLPQTPEQKLALTMQVTNRLVPRVNNLEKDVDYLKNKSEINKTQRWQLGKARNAKVVEVCGGKESNFYQQKKARKVYMQLFYQFKEQFKVPSYADVTKEQFEKALKFIKNWYPALPLKMEIQEANAQTNLDI